MSRQKASVSLVFDGSDTPKTFVLRPVAMMASERRFGGSAFQDRPIEASLYGVFVQIGMPGGADGFEAWTNTIAEIVPPGDVTEGLLGDDAADPTLATPAGPSPDSQ